MMDFSRLYYDAYSLALFIVSHEMGSRRTMDFLEKVYAEEKGFLHPDYLQDKKTYLSDTLYWMEYLIDKDTLDAEFPVVEKDFNATGKTFVRESMMSEYPDIDLFFMFMRLRILYVDTQDYERMKLRTLLHRYGYKRRSPAIVDHINTCLIFYHIQPYLRGYERCEIEKVDIDDMITFRI